MVIAQNEEPLYHNVPRNTVLIGKVLAIVTTIIVFLAIIFCFVRGRENSAFRLLGTNLIISSFIIILLTWWYHKGEILEDRFGFMILAACCLIFQAIVIDVFVWQKHIKHTTSPTLAPHTTPSIANWSTIRPPRLRQFHHTFSKGPINVVINGINDSLSKN